MRLPRASGILLHPTSLPSLFEIGDLGWGAFGFVDFLAASHQRLWQVLPLGPTGYGNSPYQCLSAFAGNPLLISLERLVEDGFLSLSDLEPPVSLYRHKVNYEAAIEFKSRALRNSFETFQSKALPGQLSDFEAFCQQQSSWLEAYALFAALKNAHNGAPWNQWEEDIRLRRPEAVERWSKQLESERMYHCFLQYLFFSQWSQLKKYCHDNAIGIMGDIPIFVALDSADVWSHPELFHLDSSGMPTVVAGVPPDYFSKTGQLWGNPIYRWEVMAQDGYAWWIERFRAMLSMVDIIRIDHFRGFAQYWEIPGKAETAEHGRWADGPGARLFEAVRKALGELPIVAENLGVITPDVEKMREQFGFPGMRVLQFAFGSDYPLNDHRPHNYVQNCVAYTGTHDNDTTIGWFNSSGAADSTRTPEEVEEEKQRALKYLGSDGREINWDFIRWAMASVADMAIIPLQDILGLGSEARMNLPGTTTGNWEWRFTLDMLTDDIRQRLREMTAMYGRSGTT